MAAAERSVTIARSPDTVFAFVADGLNGPRWRQGVLDVSLVSGSGVGAVYRQGVKGPGGRRVAADYKVTTYDPPRLLAFQTIAGPVHPRGEFRLEPVPEGTRLTFALSAELGRVSGLFLGGSVQRTMDAEVAAIERLKALVEAA